MTAKYALQRGLIALAQVATVVVFLVLWQLASEHHVLDPVFFSKPTDMWHQLLLWKRTGVLWKNIVDTMTVFLVGYVAGTVLGIVLGIVIGTMTWAREIMEPFLAFFNALPRLILLPLLIVWFGFGLEPKFILVISVIILMVALNVAAGLREVKVDYLNNARLAGATKFDLVRHVYIPSVSLWVTSTARVTVGYAFNAAIAAEFIGANKGLGFLMYLGLSNTEAVQIWTALGVTVILALVIDFILAGVETRATRWMPAA
ncbi:MAG TPA: ABC transporter permease [Acidimicrobiales bacterium]|jgi:NitT/TauT family transport system permease protein|nr:ABC transporter permease [Acidimicrobiales bacterium]